MSGLLVLNNNNSPIHREKKSVQKISQCKKPTIDAEFDFWCYEPQRKRVIASAAYENNLKKVAKFGNAAEYEESVEYVSMNFIPYVQSVMLFRSGIKPLWEQPENRNGGKFCFGCSQGFQQALSTYLLLVKKFVHGQLIDQKSEICGITLSFRPWGGTISIWNRTSKDSKLIEKVSKKIHTIAQLDEETCVLYQPHKKSMRMSIPKKRRRKPYIAKEKPHVPLYQRKGFFAPSTDEEKKLDQIMEQFAEDVADDSAESGSEEIEEESMDFKLDETLTLDGMTSADDNSEEHDDYSDLMSEFTLSTGDISDCDDFSDLENEMISLVSDDEIEITKIELPVEEENEKSLVPIAIPEKETSTVLSLHESSTLETGMSMIWKFCAFMLFFFSFFMYL